jgi:hypothetical protein
MAAVRNLLGFSLTAMTNQLLELCEISGFHGDEYEDGCLLGRCAM